MMKLMFFLNLAATSNPFVIFVIIGIIFFGTGFLAAAFASIRLIKTRREIKNWLKTKGQVVEFVKKYNGLGNHKLLFSPKIVFRTGSNQVINFVTESASRQSPYQIGDVIDVY